MRSLLICTAHPIFAGYKIEKNKIGWAYRIYTERRGVHRVFGCETGRKDIT